MSRWMLCGGLLLSSLILKGCLPPVQETPDGNTPTVSAESAEQSAHADAAAEAPAAAASATPGEFTTTATGLKYKIVKPGSAKKPTAADTVECHYKGWLDNGDEFDSSYSRGEPAQFPLGGVIPGWTEGLQLIGEGGEIELEIPGNLGYGPAGSPPKIGPNATLHFKVELLKIL